MPKGFQGEKIDTAQKAIEGLEGPVKAKAEIMKYRKDYKFAVDNAQSFVTSTKLKSSEAQAYLQTASGEIVTHLQGIATHGLVIINHHKEAESKEKGEKPEKAATLADLASTLRTLLSNQRKAILNFAKIEKAQEEYGKIFSQNIDIDLSAAKATPGQLITKKQRLSNQLKVLFDSVPTDSTTATLSDNVKQSINKNNNLIKNDISGLQAFQEDKRKVDGLGLKKAHTNFKKLVAVYDKDPSDANNEAIKAAINATDLALGFKGDMNHDCSAVRTMYKTLM